MTIDAVKSISIVDYLDRHFPENKKHLDKWGQWYLSPFRNEKEPSFKVNVEKNLWYDYARTEGGNIITLLKLLYGMSTYDIVKTLERETALYGYRMDLNADLQTISTYSILQEKEVLKQQDKEKTSAEIEFLCDLNNINLRRYVESRCVDFEIARQHCKEIHYKAQNKNGETRKYYAIAFLNIKNGMELRNKYTKRCIGSKSYSIIRGTAITKSQECCVFEGFFDFLSYMTAKRRSETNLYIDNECDYIILNSVSTVTQITDQIKEYEIIHCYLDNDEAGKTCTTKIMSLHHNVIDESYRYNNYNDINDMLKDQTKSTNR